MQDWFCVERTLLSAAFDSSSEKREWWRSSRTGQQPDARTKEFIPPFGDATQPKSPALRFAIGRATPPESYSTSSSTTSGKLRRRSRHLAHRQRQHHARNPADDHAHADQDADRPEGTQRPLYVDHQPQQQGNDPVNQHPARSSRWTHLEKQNDVQDALNQEERCQD